MRNFLILNHDASAIFSKFDAGVWHDWLGTVSNEQRPTLENNVKRENDKIKNEVVSASGVPYSASLYTSVSQVRWWNFDENGYSKKVTKIRGNK